MELGLQDLDRGKHIGFAVVCFFEISVAVVAHRGCERPRFAAAEDLERVEHAAAMHIKGQLGPVEFAHQQRDIEVDDIEPGQVTAVEVVTEAAGNLPEGRLVRDIVVGDAMDLGAFGRYRYLRINQPALDLHAALRQNFGDADRDDSVVLDRYTSSFEIEYSEGAVEFEAADFQ